MIGLKVRSGLVVEAYRLDRYDNFRHSGLPTVLLVVEAYRLDRYDNSCHTRDLSALLRCRSLSFG